MKDVVIVSGVRLPVGSYGGSLKDITAIDMGAMVVKEAVKRAGIQPSDVDEVVIGQVGEVAENGFIARAVSLKAGMPKETTAYSVNRQCGSGLQSIAEAVMEIQTGQADVVVAGGTENISRLPYYVNDARWGARMGHKVFEDGVIDILTWPLDGNHNGVTAENVAKKYHVTREEQDAFAVRSHQRACKAIKEGKFKDEIVPVEIPQRKGDPIIFDTDEFPKFGTTIEKVAKLKGAFKKDGIVTAANASGINVDRTRIIAMIFSTVLASWGQLIFLQNVGTLSTYGAHTQVGQFAIAALLVGGASVQKATNKQALLGIVLFHTLFIVSPLAGKELFGDPVIGEYFRVFVSYGVIAMALAMHAWKKTAKPVEESEDQEENNEGVNSMAG